MKHLILGILLISCGDINVKPSPVTGGTDHKFGPDFEAWLNYCKGQAQYKYEIGDITENEIDIETKSCYYNLDLNLPPLPEST